MSVDDLVVVGGGPAGLAAAIAARQRELTVRVLDRRRPPIDKPCGEGLMPDGLTALSRLGIPLSDSDGQPFRGIRYIDSRSIAAGRFPGRPGLGVRRTTLHRRLVERAHEVGVTLEWERRVTGMTREGVDTDDGPREARWIVGADGLLSSIRRWAGLAGPPSRRRRFGVRRHYRLEPWSDRVEVYWGDRLEAYVTPVAPDEVGVALLWSARKAGFDELLASLPLLERRLAGASTCSTDRGVGPLRQRVRAAAKGSVALIGDAAGYVDAITGEGLSLAFHQAHALTRALERRDLSLYRQDCRRLARRPDAMTGLLLFVERRPVLRRRLLTLLAERPSLFDRLLAVHCRERPVSSVGVRGFLELGLTLVPPIRPVGRV